jgi:hypothetical protein
MGALKLSVLVSKEGERGRNPAIFIMSFTPNRASSESLRKKKETRKNGIWVRGSELSFRSREISGES